MPLQLVDYGYDVYIGSNRGSTHSNKHVRDGDPDFSLKERWNHSWAEFGVSDMPAFLDEVVRVSGKAKVTVIGQS